MKTGAKVGVIATVFLVLGITGFAIYKFMGKKQPVSGTGGAEELTGEAPVVEGEYKPKGTAVKYGTFSKIDKGIAFGQPYSSLGIDQSHGLKINNFVKITKSNWKELNGIIARVLNVNTDGSAVIAVVPPATTDIKGEWEKVDITGTFDWIGNSDFADKKNFYAGLHLSSPNTINIDAGNMLRIYDTNWEGMEGKFGLVIRKTDSGNLVLNIPAPTQKGTVTGSFELVNNNFKPLMGIFSNNVKYASGKNDWK